jgi:hypothetical protein
MTRPELTSEIAAKVLAVVDAGLVCGLGKPEPGKMCVEAAVCYALGLPHGDDPQCVGLAVRRFKIRLNDARWSSDSARAKGLRRIAVAQLGSDGLDQREFARRVALGVIREILPAMLRARGLAVEADTLADVADLATARVVLLGAKTKLYAAADAAYAASAAYADAAASAASAAADAADAAASAATPETRDAILTQAAGIGERVLVEMGSPGAQWLDLAGPA